MKVWPHCCGTLQVACMCMSATPRVILIKAQTVEARLNMASLHWVLKTLCVYMNGLWWRENKHMPNVSTLECQQALAAYRTQKAADILLHGLMCGDFCAICLRCLKWGLCMASHDKFFSTTTFSKVLTIEWQTSFYSYIHGLCALIWYFTGKSLSCITDLSVVQCYSELLACPRNVLLTVSSSLQGGCVQVVLGRGNSQLAGTYCRWS